MRRKYKGYLRLTPSEIKSLGIAASNPNATLRQLAKIAGNTTVTTALMTAREKLRAQAAEMIDHETSHTSLRKARGNVHAL